MNLSCLFIAADTIDDIKSLAFFKRAWTSLQSCSSEKVALPNSSRSADVVLPLCSSAQSSNPLSQIDQAAIVATGATTAGTAALLLLLRSSEDDGNDNDLTLTSKNDETTT